MSVYNGKRVKGLWHKSPFCYWCGRRTLLKRIMIKNVHRPNSKKRVAHPSTATLDHIISKHYRIRNQNGERDNYCVLACYGCNQLRQRKEVEKMTLLKKYRISGLGWKKIISLLYRDFKKFKMGKDKKKPTRVFTRNNDPLIQAFIPRNRKKIK